MGKLRVTVRAYYVALLVSGLTLSGCADEQQDTTSEVTQKVGGNETICNDGLDNDGAGGADCADPDCAGFAACAGCVDADGDFFTNCNPDGSPASTLGGDCNDSDAAIHPDAQELCDQVDGNCNGLLDYDNNNEIDSDADGYCDAGGISIGGTKQLFMTTTNGNDGENLTYNPVDGRLYHTSGISDGNEYFEPIDPSTGQVLANLVPGNTYGPSAAQEISATGWLPALNTFIVMDRDRSVFHVSMTGEFSLVGTFGAASYLRGFAVVGTRVFGGSYNAAEFVEIDPSNGSLVGTVAATMPGFTVSGINGMAAHPVTGEVVAIVKVTGGARHLAVCDMTTGVCDHKEDMNGKFAALEFRTDGVLYAVGGDGAGASRNHIYTFTSPPDCFPNNANYFPGNDADGDTLADCAEASLGTDPGNTDTDGGGVDDGTEVNVDQTDPNDPADDVCDRDADGFPSAACGGDDCDDLDPSINPGAAESLCDGIDNDCQPATADDVDADADGVSLCNGDCDDQDPATFPGNLETLCDAVDNDCNAATPDDVDADGDGVSQCNSDCDDADANNFPGNTEICDGADNDCDGSVSPSEFDNDGDGFAACQGDCDDTNAATFPGAAEICDNEDNDCDGFVGPDEIDSDGDGFTTCAGDCDDTDLTRFPGAAELCNGLDDNCDTVVPADEADADSDGQRVCAGDCDDADPNNFTGNTEVCDGADNNCDAVADEGQPDFDADMTCDAIDTDDDNDGVGDTEDPDDGDPNVCGDADSDSCDDCSVGTDDLGPLADNDTANDGLDTDGDGLCDAGDTDDDGDTVDDSVDVEPLNPARCQDADGDMCDDCSQTSGPPDTANDGPDSDSDGICNLTDVGDTDGDGIADNVDADADNDGITNIEESDGIDPFGDADGDYHFNYEDADDGGDGTATCDDNDSDGRCDAVDLRFDSDGNSMPDFLDLDSDGDGISDLIESGHGATDANDDGMVDGAVGSNGLVDSLETTADAGTVNYSLADSDSDTVPDYLDLDSDGDLISDLYEGSNGAVPDTDSDGTPDYLDADSDGDTIADSYEGFYNEPLQLTDTPYDTDGDGTADIRDTDSDNDGLTDAEEAGDADITTAPVVSIGEGNPDFRVADRDGDGVLDASDNCVNTGNASQSDEDGDGIGDFCDPDWVPDVPQGDCSCSGFNGQWPTLFIFLGMLVLLLRRRRDC